MPGASLAPPHHVKILCHFVYRKRYYYQQFLFFQHKASKHPRHEREFSSLHTPHTPDCTAQTHKFRSVHWDFVLCQMLFSFSLRTFFSFFLEMRKSLLRSAFHRRKFNFLVKELCQIAFGAVSTCFIYSSAIQKFSSGSNLQCFTHKWPAKGYETREGVQGYFIRLTQPILFPGKREGSSIWRNILLLLEVYFFMTCTCRRELSLRV